MRLVLICSLILVCAATSVAADLLMTGEILMPGGPGSPTNTVKYVQKFKTNKFRMDTNSSFLPMGSQTTIVDREKNLTYRINNADKTYQVIDQDQLEKDSAFLAQMQARSGLIPATRPVLVPTGNKDRIGNFDVEEYKIQSRNGIFVFWFAPSLKKFVPLAAKGGDPGASVLMLNFPDPASYPGIPIRTIIEQEMNGMRFVTTNNVLTVEEKEISDGEFEIPAGYLRVERAAP